MHMGKVQRLDGSGAVMALRYSPPTRRLVGLDAADWLCELRSPSQVRQSSEPSVRKWSGVDIINRCSVGFFHRPAISAWVGEIYVRGRVDESVAMDICDNSDSEEEAGEVRGGGGGGSYTPDAVSGVNGPSGQGPS